MSKTKSKHPDLEQNATELLVFSARSEAANLRLKLEWQLLGACKSTYAGEGCVLCHIRTRDHSMRIKRGQSYHSIQASAILFLERGPSCSTWSDASIA